jgi:uncharacterized protein YndB with AHSA1/START domain
MTVEESTIEESRHVAAPPMEVYRAVADLHRMGEWSPECFRVLIRGTGPARAGARFVGLNRAGMRFWPTNGRVVVADPPAEFAFEISVLGIPAARWGYRFTPSGDGTELTEYWQDRRGTGVQKAVMVGLSTLFAGVGKGQRAGHNRAGMQATLARVAAAFER